MNRAEIHFHLLPGVDDGPETIDESIAMARAAHREGTGTIVATPHVRPDFVTDVSELPDRVREMQERLDREGLALEILCGAELGHEMVARLTQRELATIAVGPPHFRWLLVESPFDGLWRDFHEATDELRDRGFGVVLAHPERSADVLTGGMAPLRRELEYRTALQVNAGSLIGDYGPAARAAALLLVARGFVDAVASDAHSLERGPRLSRALNASLAADIPPQVITRPIDIGPSTLLARGVAPRLSSVAA